VIEVQGDHVATVMAGGAGEAAVCGEALWRLVGAAVWMVNLGGF
jgi:hypothetical protein